MESREPHPYAQLEAFTAAMPQLLRLWPEGRWFSQVRCVFRMSQERIGRLSGLHPSVVSRLEGSGDARLSTWRKAYDALGFDVVLLPVPRAGLEELGERATASRRKTRWWKSDPRPRRWRSDDPGV